MEVIYNNLSDVILRMLIVMLHHTSTSAAKLVELGLDGLTKPYLTT